MEPREVAKAFLDSWNSLWMPHGDGPNRHWCKGPYEQGRDLSPITGEQVREAARQMGTGKSPGHDGWRGGDLAKLPIDAQEELAELLNEVELKGQWPATMKGAVVVMLPKGEGMDPLGQRPIGLLPGIYRLWARLRVSDLKDVLEEKRLPSELGGNRDLGQMKRP